MVTIPHNRQSLSEKKVFLAQMSKTKIISGFLDKTNTTLKQTIMFDKDYYNAPNFIYRQFRTRVIFFILSVLSNTYTLYI